MKIQRHSKAPVTQYDTPSERLQHINVDLVGPLPESNGFSYLLTMIDRCTRWAEATQIANITVETVAKEIISGWISRFDVTFRISTDRGSQFDCQLCYQLNNLLGTRHFRTTAYHPQANGMIERWNRSLKVSLRAKFTKNWVDELPMVLLGLRNAVKEDLNASPAEITFGKSLMLPGQFFDEPKHRPINSELISNLKK